MSSGTSRWHLGQPGGNPSDVVAGGAGLNGEGDAVEVVQSSVVDEGDPATAGDDDFDEVIDQIAAQRWRIG